ncbi:CDP-diacylglycerol--glycerol-3-phosphate 3-phosphatidyltransferase [Sporolactobacillus laevolacticus]|uniref:CDP-diacylglycerol--glycerol-3-phosphate 3-phosphatidyltransferase n=1 Tax=Sporolactobacillus laevolacticus DSM 442 TaxID=1395513 RepID=V6J1G7_9BACL|nr:CDP-diacylglycerol--glycerol-3-phosphate 3-phosphatidyltransferase [Sporolactobacillus laevolacticus]EST13016.1 CDP-diacylglycerol--glycerol-3-phosphate 3-phosphatidyltransferase [Sporolactobacillus laevolacticus DSM 442]
MNIANKLTVSRMIMIPLFLIFLLAPIQLGTLGTGSYQLPITQLIAAIIFILASFTDWLDGQLARKYHLVTNFGKLLDPLADKLLVMSAFVSFVGLGSMASWMVILILAREFAVTGLRLVAVEEGEVIAASKIAKWKTFSQMVAVILFLFNNVPFGTNGFPLSQIILWIAVILTVLSGADYFYKNREILLRSK